MAEEVSRCKTTLPPDDKLALALERVAANAPILRDAEKCAKVLLYSHYPTIGLVSTTSQVTAGLLSSGLSKFPFQQLAYRSLLCDLTNAVETRNEREKE